MGRLSARRAAGVMGPARAAALPGRWTGRMPESGMRPGMRPDVAMGNVRTS
jgi:hypothetical protein